jgi:hypothetical protein
VDRKNALDTLAKADLSHCDGLAEARVIASDQDSFKDLETFFFAFLDLDVDADGVAGAEFRHLAEVFGDNLGQ